MRKMLFVIIAFGLSLTALNGWALDSSAALSTFSKDLQDIRAKLQAGKMSAAQAQILLQALQVRQGNVIIAQNAEILRGMSNERK